MSYKIDLSDLERDGGTSVTQQLVDRFRRAIETGSLGPGEKLPPTRALAADAGINHLTAARVYRRLAEEGYVTASVGRGTFVRALAPAAAEVEGDDWQAYVLPDRPATYQEDILSDAFRFPSQQDMISLATGWPSPCFHPAAELAEIAAAGVRRRGRARHVRARRRGAARAARAARDPGPADRRRERRRRDHRDLRRPAGHRPDGARAAPARRRSSPWSHRPSRARCSPSAPAAPA